MSSILNDVKTLLGIQNEYDAFDNELILHINTAFSVLFQLGVGPIDSAFKISSDVEEWTDFSDNLNIECVKEYIEMKVKIVWDTALPNSVIEVIKERINELEWRLRFECDKSNEPSPGPSPSGDTYSKSEIDQKDLDTLNASKTYTDMVSDSIRYNMYTKTEVDNMLSTYYTKTEIDDTLSNIYDKSEVYSKSETDNLLNDKQDILSGGDYVDITNNVISVDLSSKSDKTVISTDSESTNVSLLVQNNTEYRYTQPLETLDIDVPDGDFIASIVFASGSTETLITYPQSLKWTGDDVSLGVFTPNVDRVYNIILWFDGINVNGIVRGV